MYSKSSLLFLVPLFAALCIPCRAARFAERIRYQQPDGTFIELRGEGNEYWAVYETQEGYTVVFVPEARAYYYATLSAAGDDLVSAGLEAGIGDPQASGLAKHLRINPEVAREQARRNKSEWESRIRLGERWSKLKTAGVEAGKPHPNVLRYGPTLGTKCGLTLLVDFDDTPATFPASAVETFLNGDDYRDNGNNGSVKQYYHDVSDGKLLYTNIVVGYIRIPNSLHPRAYYNEVSREASQPVNELIRDAIVVLTNQPNYMTEVVPRLEALSVNEAGTVLAANIFVAGSDSGVWAKGLWPHLANLYAVGPQELWPGGKKVDMYQMTTMSSALRIGTFCHETGHLLCGFPDIYDYDGQSAGGAGQFCLMNSRTSPTNPQHFCAYLKLMAGWATVTDLVPGPAGNILLFAPGTNGIHFLRYRPNIFSREYFLAENRQQSGHNAQLPGSGILVWHIDELGNNNNENLLPNATHANYEVTLIQADNHWNLERNENAGDATDPFYARNPSAGYQNRFNDTTSPGASWWNGTRSGLELSDFSTKGMQMSLTAQVRTPAILRDPISQSVNVGDDLFLSIQMATNQSWSYVWGKAGASLTNDDRISGVDGPALAIRSVRATDAGRYSVIVSNNAGYFQTSRVAQVTVASLRKIASADLGDANRMPGTTAIVNNGFQVTAGGSGLLAAADGCRFLYEPITGVFDARVNVADLNPEDSQVALFGPPVFGSAGLMVRAGLEPGAPAATVLIQPDIFDSRVQCLARSSQSGPQVELAGAGGGPQLNNWVRLRREGDLVSMYNSTDGSAWDWLKTVPVPLGNEVQVEMVVSSDDPLSRVVSNLKSYILQTNLSPTFAISSLQDSAREGANERATLAVTASRIGPLQASYTIRNPALNGIAYEHLDEQLSFPAGTNVALIDIIPIDNTNAQAPTVVTISMNSSGVPQSSASAIIFDDEQQGHGLKRELYSGITGTRVSDLTTHYRYPGSPALSTVTNFESFIGQNGGQVLAGYITPPVTGPYVFYLASANASELWLSPDTSTDKAAKIAEELGTNTKRHWAGYGSTTHISAPIVLSEAHWYFVKAVHKAGFGTPHLAVAWQMPGSEPPAEGSAPIGGEYLTWALPVSSGSPGTMHLAIAPNGHLLLSFENPWQKSLVLEASSDLMSWTPIWTNSQISDLDLSGLDTANTHQPTRFYRVVGE